MERSEHTGHALRQLQDMSMFVAAGTTADTDITVTGVKVGDDIKAIAFDTGVPETVGTVTITAAATVQISTDTSGKTILFFIYPKSS